MKKIVSILIAAVIALSSFVTVFAVPLNKKQKSAELNGFIDGIVSLAREYDADKEFTVDENNETEQIQHFSAQNTADEKDSNAEPKYTLQDFQTARLIVRADDRFNDCDALEHVSGFEDFHILQYENPEAAMEAYTNLQLEKNVINVAPDIVVNDLQGETDEIISETELQNEKYLCDWSHDRTQSDRLLDYLETQDFSDRKIVVAILDSGIDYHNKIFENRIEYSQFNSSVDGNSNDEFDGGEKCHGTSVASVIVDNTPKNVKVSAYKVFNDDLTTTISQISAGYVAAIDDNPDVINASMTHISDDSGIISACLQEAYSKNIPLVAAVGNTGRYDMIQLPANAYHTIAVSATDRNNTATLWCTQSINAAVSAPGEDIIVAISNNNYRRAKGTSFSTPCVAALVANLKLVEPNITVDEIETRLKETSFDVKRYNEYIISSNANLDNFHSLWDGVGMVQFCSAFGLPELTAPEFNLESKVYVGEQICSIQCADENAKILYTTDGTYPDLENAVVYNEPFQVTERTRIRSVAYYENEGYYSREVEITPRIQYTDDDEKFTVTNDGVITAYTGTVSDLFVQDTIKGITITGIEKNAFNAPTLISLTLPKGVTEISENTFYRNKSLEFIRAEGVIEIGSCAFDNSNIMYAEFPNAKVIRDSAFSATRNFCFGDFSNVESIESYAFGRSNIISFYGPSVSIIWTGVFSNADRLQTVSLPKCKELLPTVNEEFESCKSLVIVCIPLVQDFSDIIFSDTTIIEADFPALTTISSSTFANCISLHTINLPSLVEVPNNAFANGVNRNSKPRTYKLDEVRAIGKNGFGKYITVRVEFSHLETTESLPQTEGCIISMPSTFSECTEATTGRNYKVYGTKGTYAEQWANENGHEFIEISQDTAILQDVPMEYTDKTQVLSPDVIGFNRTYQWYANDKADNTTGTAIEGATNRDFNPADYPAKYYYCVVTSTDVGYDPIEIRTGVTENKTLKSADYSAYDAAVLKANALEREYYKDLTALDAALAVDVSGLTALEQDIVDAQTKAIEDALTALEFKDADYSAYSAAAEKAQALDKSLYADTTELDKLLAEDISGLTILNQDIVDEQTRAIEDALKNLVFKSADYTEYDKAVEQANAIDRSLYKDLTALDEALSVDVSGKNITEQDIVDAQTQAILDALNSLEKKPISTTVSEEPTQPNQPEPSVPDETTKPNTSEESTTSADTNKPDIPNTNGTAPISCTVALLTLLSACIYITSRKRKNTKNNIN